MRSSLFPRHLHRLSRPGSAHLETGASPRILRSAIRQPVESGVILWDTFGELNRAYAAATTVFVGGTLARLGGQNFLEPLAYGISPVIGPHWETFLWVGQAIVRNRLVRVGRTWQAVLEYLEQDLTQGFETGAPSLERAAAYIRRRQGGTLAACELIRTSLETAPWRQGQQTHEDPHRTNQLPGRHHSLHPRYRGSATPLSHRRSCG
jgi:3-deoxy-D-manno-octulosonic-acid transferase